MAEIFEIHLLGLKMDAEKALLDMQRAADVYRKANQEYEDARRKS